MPPPSLFRIFRYSLTLVVGLLTACLPCGAANAATEAVKLPLPAGFKAGITAQLDADGDTRTDLFVANAGDGPDRILLNRKNGWRSVSVNTGGGRTLAAVVADLDRDGHDDIVIGKSTGLVLAINDGKGGFHIRQLVTGTTAAWALALADINSDGWVDIIAGREAAGASTPLLWLNDGVKGGEGAPHFHASGAIAGCCDIHAVAVADIKIDGYLDLLVLHDDGTVDAYINDSRGNLQKQADMLPGGPWTGMAVADIDNNVDADVFLYGQKAVGTPPVYRLLRNDGHQAFTDVTAAAGLKIAGPIGGAWWADLNEDGWPDLVLAAPSGHGLNVAYQNGDLKFDLPVAIDAGGLAPGPTLDMGDIDRQGHLELIAPMRDAPLGMLTIATARSHWVGLRLKGREHAPVLGTFVVLSRPDGSFVTRQVTRGGPLLIPVGWRTQVQLIAIYWDNGIISRIHPNRVDQYWSFDEPDNPHRGAGRPSAP